MYIPSEINPKSCLLMATSNNKRRCIQTPKPFLSFFQKISVVIFFHFLHSAIIAEPLHFTFPSFQPHDGDIKYYGSAVSHPIRGTIDLTSNGLDVKLKYRVGRAIYHKSFHLWDSKTRKLSDFTTSFSFAIKSINQPNEAGDGLAFFLSRNGSNIPPYSAGGFLGLVSNDSMIESSPSESETIVAVEFDTFKNVWDPNDSNIGINLNSIHSDRSVPSDNGCIKGRRVNATVSYNATIRILSVFLINDENPNFCRSSTLQLPIDLREILPDYVHVGFSAATGNLSELHQIRSWKFSSTDIDKGGGRKKWERVGFKGGLTVGIGVLVFSLCLSWFWTWRRGGKRLNDDDVDYLDVSMDDEFERGTGPKKFSRQELALATNNFAADGKLGQGGFGGVYRGFLNELNLNVAVKRVSQGSSQGRKEFVSEVKVVSRLRHRNLVQLIGWCHERGEFLLVYEFMPNGSLDFHLFGGKSLLSWATRFKIAQGLAQALLYLQDEWQQCVVHRDVKSSNVMLDSDFNAKLGDFGLARLVDHDRSSPTTNLAGTIGYLAPECVVTGKASKESDVYCFGVVALEIACGRRAVEPRAEGKKARLVEWVWDLYGRGSLLDASDSRLNREFDEKQMECLMIVGLWCAHTDPTLRPSIRQVISVLGSEAPLPSLPSRMPVPVYISPSMSVGIEPRTQNSETWSMELTLPR